MENAFKALLRRFKSVIGTTTPKQHLQPLKWAVLFDIEAYYTVVWCHV